jgi:hypothetical protein
MSLLLFIALAGGAGLLFLVGGVLMRRRRIRAARKRARGPLPPAAKRVQGEARMLLGRTDVLIAATKKTSFQPSAEVVEVSMIDTAGMVRLDLVVLPTGTITREATAAHGIDRDELQRLDAPHYRDVHAQIAAALAAAAVVLAYDAPLEKRSLHRTAAGYELELPDADWRCVRIAYSEYHGIAAKEEGGLRHWTLPQAARREGIALGNPHLRALGDCRTMLSLLEAITGSPGT